MTEVLTDQGDPRPSDRDLTTGSISRHMARLSGFLMLGMISFNIASLIETFYIGIVGTNELAAISFTFPVVMTLQSVSMGLAVGAGSVAARRVGSGDMQKVRRLTTHCVIMASGLSVVIAAIAYFFLSPVFSLLGASAEVLPLVISYMSIWLIGMPVFAMTFVGTTLMRASGDAVTPGYLSALGSVLHIAIAPFFIFGIGDFPELGLPGAAIGFVIARSIEFLVIIYCFAFRDRLMLFELDGFSQSVREILHVGLPAMAANLIMPVSMGVTTRLLAGHGTAVVAGFGVAMRIEFMAIMMIFAVSMSISPIVGQNWGAKLYDRVKTVMRTADIFIMAWGVAAYLVLITFGDFFVGLINDDPQVVEAAYNYLLIGPLAVGAMGVTFNATHCFNALGKPMPPLIISLLRMIVVNIPLILLGNYLWGYMGIFVGTVVTTIALAVVARHWINQTIDRSMQRTLSPGLSC